MKIELNNRIAVITGGSGELGRAIVRTLAECGASIAIHYFHQADKARKVLEEIRPFGARYMMVQADVTDAASVQAMKEKVTTGLGDADIIVNNAVIQYTWAPVLEQNASDYEGQFRSCVLHNVYMAQAFVPGMIRKHWGRVIAINTECVMQNYPNQSAYVSGKRGMDGVLRVLAREIGEHQITVNQVAPGWMVSENVPDGAGGSKGYKEKVPLKRRGSDQDIANLVAFLASDLAGFISGAFIPVSGGTVMPAI
ncbi:MAG: SDR family oxidoreductase [Anaerolineaceae bacterium]|jgi:3-oxoacyl-[acyl-carrier protein] reductase